MGMNVHSSICTKLHGSHAVTANDLRLKSVLAFISELIFVVFQRFKVVGNLLVPLIVLRLRDVEEPVESSLVYPSYISDFGCPGFDGAFWIPQRIAVASRQEFLCVDFMDRRGHGCDERPDDGECGREGVIVQQEFEALLY